MGAIYACRQVLLCVVVATLLLAVAACSGNNNAGSSMSSASSSSSSDPLFVNYPRDTEPSIQWWSKISSSTPVSGAVSLQAAALWTTTGIKKVEFLIDSVVAGTLTSTSGAKQPGVPLFVFFFSWDTSHYSDGPHTLIARVTDNLDRAANTETITAIVKNQITMAPALVSAESSEPVDSVVVGNSHFAVNLATGEFEGNVTVDEVVPFAVHIHDGFAGTSGGQVLRLQPDGSGSNRWVVPAGTFLSPEQIDQLQRGALYIDIDSTLFPDGEVRAQLK